ncbi:extracellular solute-binding protein [Dongia soli]|uniref:Extracellular solute-binding protein n=1 Tax=Dongia soli TaxID=600628 RepID=A0ABU5E7K8_9PROT|nr:extracellular solute-binding protein [Dongia soli]MDY0881694.1 extracellular solute-binding protein [Dongia soli]
MRPGLIGSGKTCRTLLGLFLLAASVVTAHPGLAQEGQRLHALTFLDQPKYGPDFKHLDYVDPNAPKGGSATYAVTGQGDGATFDNFNPFTIRGTAATMPGVFETLTVSPDDDVQSGYGLLAESMELAKDKTWIIFDLRPEARWQDGQPLTADDVVFSFNILKQKGPPVYRFYYGNVTKAEALDKHRVKFTFVDGTNRELPIIMGQLTVMPKHIWEKRNLEDPLPQPPIGSGPYKVLSYEMGRSITLQRVPDYWGKDLPINIGRDNIDTIRYDYYRDPTIAFQAFKSGAVDFRQENIAKNWATGYDIPAVRNGQIKREEIPDATPYGFQGFAFNTRRAIFADRRVRQAIIYALDFEWSNKTLFYGAYSRNRSYFDNSELAATGLPSPEELKLLEPFRGKIPDEVFTQEYQPPKTDGSGDARANLDQAAKLLDAAGWPIVNGKRERDGQRLQFEILLNGPSFERVALPFTQNLKRIGIDATIRTVDTAQYDNRTKNFDFDMVVIRIGQSLSPGNEQRDYFGSQSANEPNSNNLMGVRDPVVDALIEKLITAPTHHDVVIATRALDRVLQWGFYMVPHWVSKVTRIAYWDKFGQPAKRPDPTFGIGQDSWWIDPVKVANLKQSHAIEQAQQAQANASSGDPAEQKTEAPKTDTPAAAPPSTQDRGQTPIYGVLIGVVVGFVLGRLGRKK